MSKNKPPPRNRPTNSVAGGEQRSASGPNGSEMISARSEVPKIDRAVFAHRLVQFGILATLLWKWSFFRLADDVYEQFPLEDPFFPEWLRSNLVLRIAFVSTVSMGITNLITTRPQIRRWCSWITLLGTSILCIHQGSYNDMTFVTAWWTSLWALWYAHRLGEEQETVLLRKAAFLSRLIISLILLGGGVGKWTAEYWSGAVFYDIYFVDRDYWVFNILRSSAEPDMLREISLWYSRKVIVLETMAGLGLWLLPPRLAGLIGMIFLASIAIFSNMLLFSVVSCLIALAAVGLLVPRKVNQPDQSSTTRSSSGNQSATEV